MWVAEQPQGLAQPPGQFPAVSRKRARTPTAYVPAKSYVLVKA